LALDWGTSAGKTDNDLLQSKFLLRVERFVMIKNGCGLWSEMDTIFGANQLMIDGGELKAN
jgi:hypothetical protein